MVFSDKNMVTSSHHTRFKKKFNFVFPDKFVPITAEKIKGNLQQDCVEGRVESGCGVTR